MIANNLAAGYVLVEGYPSVADYQNIREQSGLTPRNVEQATKSLAGSWYGVYIAEETAPAKAVAMGRVIGDGGWYFIIADMATLPAHQRKGLGDAVLKKLVAEIERRAAKGQAYVSLGADLPGRKLYLKNGFQDAMPATMGMQRHVQGQGQ
ncbi:hypothetical protein RRF57_010342 [Xylaria bambusicola]|uniref:N-acetyltransferase domain-containing protein n=1 Tax=Xylaria bambusicola TaxID=326684 RepID=A0AAN7UUU8_9PEZI